MELPEAFTAYTQQLMGEALFSSFSQALDNEPSTSIRLNLLKSGSWEPSIAAVVPWCPTGRYLGTRPAFTFDPLLHAGAYYVQEAASMFASEVARQLITSPSLVLDLCAAPGGKSTALRSALPDGSLLIANEPIPLRANVLAENLQKWGHPDVMVTNNYPRDFRKTGLKFDAVFADMPCSGEGMFRKDPTAIADWSAEKVSQCAALQRSIAEDIWPCLKPGGLMVYSTCTFNAHEDEENVAWIAGELGADFVALQTETDWHITGALTGSNPVYRFIPGHTRGEGLFLAVLRKNGEAVDGGLHQPKDKKSKEKKNKSNSKTKDSHLVDIKVFTNCLKGEYSTTVYNNRLMAIPSVWSTVWQAASANLHVLHAGVTLATTKGKNFIPHPSLALTTALAPEAFPTVDLDYAQAVRFLRCEALTLPAGTPKGFTIVSYRHLPLGFVKNIGLRANNLYPPEWKIKSTHIPDQQQATVL